MSKKFATINDVEIFNQSVAKAKDSSSALRVYDEIFTPKLKSFNIALDDKGEMMDSFEFADLLKDKNEIAFFIGGAYGLSDEFLKKASRVVSLTRLTLAHKVAKLVLFEQIFRALCINANHPYHK